MILTESTYSLFNRKSVISESVHLPHGITSAKVITHLDLDGLASAISLIHQLVKQGIKKERINVEFAQYGDEEKVGQKEVKKFQPKNRQQWVGVTDYANYPKAKIWQAFNSLMDFKGNEYKYKFVKFANSRDFSKIANIKDFKNILLKSFNNIKEGKFSESNIEELYNGLKAYSNWGKKDVGEITLQNLENYKVSSVKPDFGSDHHSNEDGNLSAAQRGDLAAESPSEAALFANKYAPGLWSKDDLAAISMVDSADFTEDELKNTIFLEKHFTGPNKKRNLASIISLLYDNLAKKDEKVAKWIALNSGTSLVSLYSTLLRGLKLNGERLRMLEAIKKGDMKTGAEIAAALPKILNKRWMMKDSDVYKDRNGMELKRTTSRESFVDKNLEDLKNAKTGYKSKKDLQNIEDAKKKLEDAKADAKARKVTQKNDPAVIQANDNLKKIKDIVAGKKGKIFVYNNFTFFVGNDKKVNYGRYMVSLMSEKGQRSPYVLRYWPYGMFQIAINPIYKKALPNENLVDFSVVSERVLNDVRNYMVKEGNFSEFNADRIVKIMKEAAGGHKGGIWTFSKFDKVKPSSKELGSYYNDRDMVERANKIVMKKHGESGWRDVNAKINNARSIVPQAAERLDKIENSIIKNNKEFVQKLFEFAITRSVYWTNKLYPPKQEGLDALKNNDERFEMN